MTTMVKTEILGTDFDLDECADIATHGCIAGVGGFIYTVDNIETYDEHEYKIMDELDVWADELGATNGMEMIMDSLKKVSLYKQKSLSIHWKIWSETVISLSTTRVTL